MNTMVEDEIQSAPSMDIGEMIRPRGIGRNYRVLVAEDNIMQREVIRDVLLAIECQVQVASDGAEALDRYEVRLGCFDLVLTDLEMPRMNGVELAQAVRRLSPGQPIVVMSANFKRNIQKHIPDGLVVGILEKPFGIADLRQILDGLPDPERRWIDRR